LQQVSDAKVKRNEANAKAGKTESSRGKAREPEIPIKKKSENVHGKSSAKREGSDK